MVKKAGAPIGGEALSAGTKHQQCGARAKAGDLLLPLGLQRSRANDEHALDALAPRQQFAGGDGLDGFAEPHVVGEQRPFAEGEMHGPEALVGQQRMGQDVEARTAGGDVGGEGRLRFTALTLAPRPLQPRLKMTGNANLCACCLRRLRPGGEHALDGVRRRRQRAIGAQPRSQPIAGLGQRRFGGAQRPDERRGRRAAPVEKNLDARASFLARRAKCPRLTASQRRQHALDVLACPERVHSVVDAAAGVRQPTEASDLHVVTAAAGRADAKIAKKTAIRLDGDDIENSVRPRQRRRPISSSSLVAQPETGLRSSAAAALLLRVRLPDLAREGRLSAVAFFAISCSMLLVDKIEQKSPCVPEAFSMACWEKRGDQAFDSHH